jgi:hypothetical protein
MRGHGRVPRYSRQALLVYAVLLVAGGCWMAVMSTFNTATQTSVPPWVRARHRAAHLVRAGLLRHRFGVLGRAVGPGRPAGRADAGGVGMLAGCCWRRPFPLRMGELGEVTQVKTVDNLFIVHEPDPEAGPVAVEIGYRIAPTTPRPSWTP